MGGKLGKCKKSFTRKRKGSTHITPQLIGDLDEEHGSATKESQDNSSRMLISLDELPRELVWSIVEYIPESVLKLRLVSRYFKSCVDEYSTLPVIMPLVHTLSFGGTPAEMIADSDCMTIAMYACADKLRLFKLRIMLGNHPRGFMKRFNRKKGCSLTFDCVNDKKNLLEYLSICIGRRIGKVSLCNCNDVIKLSVVTMMLSGKQFGKLAVMTEWLSVVAEKHLLKTITTRNVNRLEFIVGRIENAHPKELLIQLSSHVNWLRIDSYGRAVHGTSDRCDLSKISIDDLPNVILEMFSKKLDGLDIRTSHYLEFKRTIQLIEELSRNSDKKFWFTVNTICYPGFPHSAFPQYYVYFEEHAIGYYSRINVKHLSRLGETPF